VVVAIKRIKTKQIDPFTTPENKKKNPKNPKNRQKTGGGEKRPKTTTHRTKKKKLQKKLPSWKKPHSETGEAPTPYRSKHFTATAEIRPRQKSTKGNLKKRPRGRGNSTGMGQLKTARIKGEANSRR